MRQAARPRSAATIIALAASLAGFAGFAALLLVASPAHAAAGSGSANFGDGGFGGGDGGGGIGGGLHGGGKGFAIYVAIRLLIDIALIGHGLGLLVLLAVAICAYLYMVVWPKLRAKAEATADRGRAHRRTTQQRERKVELAAAEAADQNDIFDPERVRADAATLFADIQEAWDADDREALRGLITGRLADEWTRRLDDMERRGWRNRVRVVGTPKVEYVGLRNTSADVPTVTVRIEAKLRDFVRDTRTGRKINRSGQFGETVKMREYWTLEHRDGRWMLASIEHGAEGTHQLQDTVVQTDWADTEGLRDEAMLEGAAASTVPDGTDVGALVSVDVSTDAQAAANDLSVADGRFAPDVLAVCARRAAAAWAQAIDGSVAALGQIADPQTVDEMLFPTDPTRHARLVLRGAKVQGLHVTALDASATPPMMTVDVELTGTRYVQDRDTAAVLAGSATRTDRFTQRWTFALTGDEQQPWRIVGSASPTGTGA